MIVGTLVLGSCGRLRFDEQVVVQPQDAAANLVGCADGERDAFIDRARFPTVAGCAASWPGTPSLRDARDPSRPCGDDGAACVAPADACAVGWHICGDTGDPTDLTLRVTNADCMGAGDAGSGSFVAAMGHCVSCNLPCDMLEADCVYSAAPLECYPTRMSCSEPVCCGPACESSNLCRAGVFPSNTRIGTMLSVCGALAANQQTGVMCCAD